MTTPSEPYRSRSSGDPRHVPRQNQHLDLTSEAGEKQAAAVRRRQGDIVNSRADDSMGRGDVTIGERPDPVTGEQSKFSYVTDFKRPRPESKDPVVSAMRKSAGKGQHHLTFNLLDSGLQPADLYKAIHRRAFDGATKKPGNLPQEIHAIYRDTSGREQIKVFNQSTLKLIARKSGVPEAELDNIFIKQGQRSSKKAEKSLNESGKGGNQKTQGKALQASQGPSTQTTQNQTVKKQDAAQPASNSKDAKKSAISDKVSSTVNSSTSDQREPTGKTEASVPLHKEQVAKRVSGGPKTKAPSTERIERARKNLAGREKPRTNVSKPLTTGHSKAGPATESQAKQTPSNPVRSGVNMKASETQQKSGRTSQKIGGAHQQDVGAQPTPQVAKHRGGPVTKPPSARRVEQARAAVADRSKTTAGTREQAKPTAKTTTPKTQTQSGGTSLGKKPETKSVKPTQSGRSLGL